MADVMTPAELWACDFVRRHYTQALDQGMRWYQDSVEWAVRTAIEGVASPLEAAFLAWWLVVAIDRHYSDDVALHTQPKVYADGEWFRLDFAIVPAQQDTFAQATELHLPISRIAVELDGHDFHERTKEQVAQRDRRDRLLQAAGWRILHFSGAEFHRDPLACVHAAYTAAADSYADLRHRMRALQGAAPEASEV